MTEGYELILTIHDETVCEAPDRAEFSGGHLASILARNPYWAPDLPLAAAGFECYVFRKG